MWVRKQRKCKKYELWISPSRKRWVEKKEEIKKKYELWISRTEKKEGNVYKKIKKIKKINELWISF